MLERQDGAIAYLGLDYPAADIVLRRRGLADADFADLQLMEAAALEFLNEPRE